MQKLIHLYDLIHSVITKHLEKIPQVNVEFHNALESFYGCDGLLQKKVLYTSIQKLLSNKNLSDKRRILIKYELDIDMFQDIQKLNKHLDDLKNKSMLNSLISDLEMIYDTSDYIQYRQMDENFVNKLSKEISFSLRSDEFTTELKKNEFYNNAIMNIYKKFFPEIYDSVLNKFPLLKFDELKKIEVSKLDNDSKIKYLIQDAKTKKKYLRIQHDIPYSILTKYEILERFKSHQQDSQYYLNLLSDLNTTHDELMEENNRKIEIYVNKLMEEYDKKNLYI